MTTPFRLRAVALLALLAALRPGLPPAAAIPPAEDLLEPARLERMLDDGDVAWVAAAFRRQRTAVLPFIDAYLEGGLAMIEKSGDEEGARASWRRALQFAEAATRAFDDDVLERYAAAFASWSPIERTRFREGQAAFRAGRAAERDGAEPETTLAHYRRSLELATSLDDSWGIAMAGAGVARAEFARGAMIQAVRSGRDAANLNRRIGLEGPEVEMLLLLGTALDRIDQRRGGLPDYSRAWLLVRDRDVADATRRRVFDAYRTALAERGRPEDLAELDETGGYASPGSNDAEEEDDS